jgi:bacterial/archaeal transporter family-2 protein
MAYLPHLIAILVGAGLTLQIGMNATVRGAIDSTLIATIVNFAVGLIALGSMAVFAGARVPLVSLQAVPVWAWFGGVLGAVYVAAATALGPRLGAAVLLALTLVGQMLAALVVDHYGAIGFTQVPVTASRVAGVVLLVVGVVLIMRR